MPRKARKANGYTRGTTISLTKGITLRDLLTVTKTIAATIVGLAAMVSAWYFLGWPIPASEKYVNNQLQASLAAIKPRIINLELQGYQSSLDAAEREKRDVTKEKSDLEIQAKTVRDQMALSIIQHRLDILPDTLSKIDQKISNINRQISEVSKSPPLAEVR